MRTCCGILSLSLSLSLASAVAGDYQQDIKPLLRKHCVACHGPIEQQAGLRLDTGRGILLGGKHGPIVNLDLPAESPLLIRIAHSNPDERMPPEGPPLTENQIRQLQDWITAGARFPPDEPTPASPRDHWAFQPVHRPDPPAVRRKDWCRNPVDRFILARLEANQRQPAPPARPEVLLRRIHLDLIGLPPTPPEQDEFSQSPDLDAVIDHLLAHPGYGERWARHWLDAVRYADSNGYERDATKPFVWRYRDYVIDALNADKPYDRFLVEQLAGDELPDRTAETMIATGFLRLGHWDDEPADPATDRYDQLDDVVNTLSQGWLGLTMGCARCHDHKFEPLSQQDYYSLVAVFDPLRRPQRGRTELAVPAGTWAEVEALREKDAAIARLEREATQLKTDFQRAFLASDQTVLPAAVAEGVLQQGRKISPEHQRIVESNRPIALRQQLEGLENRIRELRRATPDLPLAYAWEEPSAHPPVTHVLLRGQPGRPGPVVPPAAPRILAHATDAPFPGPNVRTTRRRLGLAQWITHPDNPVTARVIVNRVWSHHFGRGLVGTLTDFGIMGDRPTHPELLDWLADWFMHDADWSLKKLHRLILTSQAWRMAGRAPHPDDPENHLLSQQNHRRLEVEAIRDSILAVSGRLNRTMYGPHTYPSVPSQALEGHSDPEKIWQPLDEASASRRTVYAFNKRSLMIPMLEVLDVCDTTQPSPGRRVTTVAPQALTLYNGEFVNRQARHFAARLRAEAGDDTGLQIRLAYRLALCRAPTASEQAALAAFLEKESLEQACRVIFNLNEFVYPD